MQYKVEYTHAIEVQSLMKRFGGYQALDGMTFEVPEGVIAGFVGPNGSGKTTTMRVMNTLLKPDSGYAKIYGHDTRILANASAIRRILGFMPDNFGLYLDMTAGQYLDFFAAAYRIPFKKRQMLIDQILELVGLNEHKKTMTSWMSRGMQQRLSLGRTLIHDPKLLVLDEPASGLDPRARVELKELLEELRAMGKTIFISSHILTELHQICEYVVIIDKGQLVFSGGVDEASDQVLGTSKFVEIQVTSDAEEARTKLNELEGVLDVRIQDHMLHFGHKAELSVPDILAYCVHQKIQVSEVRKSRADLEEVFLQLTT